MFFHSAYESSGIIHRALPCCPPSHSRPSVELYPVLLRGTRAAFYRLGGFWVTNGLLPRAESESERLVVQTSLVHWSFSFHSAPRIFWHHPQSAAVLLTLAFPPFLRTFYRVVAGSRGRFLSFRRILGDQRPVAAGQKRIRTAGRANFVGPLVVFLSLEPRIFRHPPQSAAVLLTLASPPFLRTFSHVVAGGSGPLPVVSEDSG